MCLPRLKLLSLLLAIWKSGSQQQQSSGASGSLLMTSSSTKQVKFEVGK